MELNRSGTRAFLDALLAGDVIGLPPILNFGSPEIQAKLVPEILSGKKYICLAITGGYFFLARPITMFMQVQRHSPEVMSAVYRRLPFGMAMNGS